MHLACLINGAPPLLPLQFCCSLSACPLSRDWHSQPSADSLKLGLQPCSFLSTRTTYSEASGHPRSPQTSCSFKQRCKARRPLSPWTRPPILDSRHSGLGAAGTSESTHPGLKAASSFCDYCLQCRSKVLPEIRVSQLLQLYSEHSTSKPSFYYTILVLPEDIQKIPHM